MEEGLPYQMLTMKKSVFAAVLIITILHAKIVKTDKCRKTDRRVNGVYLRIVTIILVLLQLMSLKKLGRV